jgi:hypothetical protein
MRAHLQIEMIFSFRYCSWRRGSVDFVLHCLVSDNLHSECTLALSVSVLGLGIDCRHFRGV